MKDNKVKPTIEELEAILEEDECVIHINPDGSISAVEKPKIHRLETILGSKERKSWTY